MGELHALFGRVRRCLQRRRLLQHLTPERWASACLRRSSAFTWLALRALCAADGFTTFARVYGYFRWADDVVDAPGRDPSQVARFVAAQRALIAGERAPELLPEHAVRRALASDTRLLPILTGMWEALAFDAVRGPAPIPGERLDRQVTLVGDAYLDAMWICTAAPGRPPSALYALSRAATLTHVLRDLEVDLALGYTNLPPDVPAGDSDAVADWVHARAAEAEALFAAGAKALPEVPAWRTRWLVGLFAWRYRRLLARVRATPSPPNRARRAPRPSWR